MPKRIIGPKKPTRETALPGSMQTYDIDNKGFLERRGIQLTTISPALIKNARNQAASGNLGPLHELYEKMETSETFFGGLVSVLKSGVSGMTMQVNPAQGLSKEEQLLADEFAVLLEEQMKMLDVHQLNKVFLDAYFRGVRAIECNYRLYDFPYGRSFAFVDEFMPVAPSRLRWETSYTLGEWGELMIATQDNQRGKPVREFPDGKVIFVASDPDRGRWDLMGAARRTIPWFMLKIFAQSWWADYAEIYGKPVRVAKYPKSSSSKTLDTIEEFLKRLGEDAYGMFPEGVQVDLIEANRGGNISTFEDIIDKCNQEISIALVGQSETSLAPDQGGAGARAAVLSNIRREVLKELSNFIARGWRAICAPLVRLNYGEELAHERLLPHVDINIASKAEMTAALDQAVKLLDSGMPVKASEIYDKAGYHMPARGDIVVFGGSISAFGGMDERSLEDGPIEANSNDDGDQDVESGNEPDSEEGEGSPEDGSENQDEERDDERADAEIERRAE